MTRIDIVHVPYKASGAAVSDVIAGHVQAMMIPVHTAAPFVTSGKLRILAVTSATRAATFPEVPTATEQGVPSLLIQTWYAAFAPAGISVNLIAKINADLISVLKEPGVREMLARQGMASEGSSPERLGEFLRAELGRWRKVVRAAGIRAD